MPVHRLALGFFLSALLIGCAGGPSRLVESEHQLAELEKQNALLRQHIRTLQERLQVAVFIDSGCPPVSPLAIDALVLDVNRDLKRVVLNKGKHHGVEAGYTFDVYLGSTYKGQVRVLEVQGGLCACVIVTERNEIVRGDSASTFL